MAHKRRLVISLFSGAMGLDLGLEDAGLDTGVCVEFDKDCCNTIAQNRPKLPVIHKDIREVSFDQIATAAKLKRGEVFAVVGGPPCQSFSTGGLRQSIRDGRGSLFVEFLRVIREAQPLYFVFENVGQIITAAAKHRPIAERPGKRWHLSSYKKDNGTDKDGAKPLDEDEQAGSAINLILDAFDELGYSLNLGVLNSADYGVAQRRFRLIIFGSRVHRQVALPKPTHSEYGRHGLPTWRTLRDAIGDLEEESPLHSNYTAEFQAIFERVPPGGNWRDLPIDLAKKALGEKAYIAGGGKTGFFRRLSWDEPTPTMVGKPNRKSCAICHPDAVRPLTVREMARVQGFPDDWLFTGPMHAQYLQVGNAVPVGLGCAIGQALVAAHDEYLRQRPKERKEELEHLHDWKKYREEMLRCGKAVLQAAARNKAAQRNSAEQGLLFT